MLLAGILLVLSRGEDVDYTHQNTWDGVCTTGKRQSPIDIEDSVTDTCGNAKFAVSFWDGLTSVFPSTTQPSNLLSTFPSSIINMVDMDGNVLSYTSAQYHIHVGSEHRVNGVQVALELHLVHKLSSLFQNTNNYAVIGLLFYLNESSATNLFDQIDFTQNQRVNFKTIFDPMIAPYPVYHYQGSFTTPTCNEVVNWFVVQKQFPIRQAQLDAIAIDINNHEHNSRDAQPLNGRKIRLISPSCNANMPVLSVSQFTNSLTSFSLKASILAGLLFAMIVIIL